MKVYVALWCLLNVSVRVTAQSGTFDIQEIVIQDTFLREQIAYFIDEQLQKNEDFRQGLGYVKISKKAGYQDDTLYSYLIYDQYPSYDKDYLTFPTCYAQVKGRLVLFDTEVVTSELVQYSKKSKRRFRKKLEPFLPPKEHLLVKDEAGNIKIDDPNFRPDEMVKLHGYGRLLYVFRDRPPEAKQSTSY